MSACLPANGAGCAGAELSERVLRRQTSWQEHLGTSSTAVVMAAKALGFVDSRESFGLRLHDLRDALRAGIYPIVGVGLEPYGRTGQHTQVVVRVTSRGVSIHGPLLGRITPNLLTFEITVHQEVVAELKAPPQLSEGGEAARRLLAIMEQFPKPQSRKKARVSGNIKKYLYNNPHGERA